jgi:hypothetical protein
MKSGGFAAAMTAAICILAVPQLPGYASQRGAPTDLDALMARALAHRDQNWKKLDQYVLDEREVVDVHGPDDSRLFADRRDYTWYIRDGLFVRSPVRANGVAVSEADRRQYETRWLEREKRRERAAAQRAAGQSADPEPTHPATAQDISGLLRETREPRFVTAGHFLEFKFEPGNYYLAGRETLDGRDVLRVEYVPTNLFRQEAYSNPRFKPPGEREREINNKLNKTALVTLWVEPDTAEVRRYTFDSLGLDFLPAAWLVRLTDARVEVTMAEPFAGILLPSTVNIQVAMALAAGKYHLNYDLEYHDYKQARTRSTVLPSR